MVPDEEQSIFILNSIKHHLPSICDRIKHCINDRDLPLLSFELVKIGHSPLDLYTGTLQQEYIFAEIRSKLCSMQKLAKEDYMNWIGSASGYRMLEISDHSSWTLRFLDFGGSYIHLHPSRNSVHTVRVNAALLKTVILFAAFKNVFSTYKESNLATINFLREYHLSLPPLKKISNHFHSLLEIIKKGSECHHCPG